MPGKLLAWTEQRENDTVLASYVGEGALGRQGRKGRAPATHKTTSVQEAHSWVEQQARQLGLPVQWLDHAPV